MVVVAEVVPEAVVAVCVFAMVIIFTAGLEVVAATDGEAVTGAVADAVVVELADAAKVEFWMVVLGTTATACEATETGLDLVMTAWACEVMGVPTGAGISFFNIIFLAAGAPVGSGVGVSIF